MVWAVFPAPGVSTCLVKHKCMCWKKAKGISAQNVDMNSNGWKGRGLQYQMHLQGKKDKKTDLFFPDIVLKS